MKKVISVTRNIYWLYKPYLKYAKLTVIFSVIFGVIIMPLARVLAVCFPEMVMSSLSENAGFLKTFYLVLMVSAVQFVVPVFEDFFNICIRDKYNAKVEAHVKREVYEKALLTDYKYIDSPEFYDDYTWAVDEYSNRCKEAFLLFEDTISTVSVIAGLMVAALAEVPLAVFFALFSIIFRTWGYLKINRLELSRQNECIAYDRKRDYVHRTFYSRIYAADLKSTRLGDMLLRDYDRACAGKVCTIANYARKIFAWAFKCDLVYRISMILIIMSIVYSIYSGDIAETGAYVTLMLAVERLDGCLYELFEVIKRASSLELYAARIRRFFERISMIEVSNGNILPDEGAFKIEFRSVSFGYTSSDFSISDLSFMIGKGERIAIVGENGAGKSTILKLLLRLYDVNSGCILINGIPITEYDVSTLRNKIGVAFQNTHVYALSFRENVELYNKLDDKELDDMVNRFHFQEIFAKTKSGLRSQITREFDDSGMELSGGEVQKIGLARVVSGDFGLLILDEPSSALDPFSEHEVIQMMNAANTTTIVIAHRLSTVKNADRILLIDKGTVIEAGTHEELMRLGKKYYEMYTLQAESYT